MSHLGLARLVPSCRLFDGSVLCEAQGWRQVDGENPVRNSRSATETGRKKKTANALPTFSRGEAGREFPKTQASLVRTTVADKETKNSAAKSVHLPTTASMVKSALMVTAKLP